MKDRIFEANGCINLREQRNLEGVRTTYIAWKPGISMILQSHDQVLEFYGEGEHSPVGVRLRKWLVEG